MKSILNKILSIIVISTLLFGCEDDSTGGVTKTTYYVDLNLVGDATINLPVGNTYVEPGFTALENGEDVSSKVSIGGDQVNSNQIGLYNISYSVANVDGFLKTVERTVIVYNPAVTADISGTYTVSSGSYRIYNGTKGDFSGYSVTIEQSVPGIFNVSDLIGGYYDQGRAYGSAYALEGIVSLESDNTITALSGYIAGWGNSYDSVTNASYDPTTGTITWDTAYNGNMVFHIILKK